jgi:hypothetical protein
VALSAMLDEDYIFFKPSIEDLAEKLVKIITLPLRH